MWLFLTAGCLTCFVRVNRTLQTHPSRDTLLYDVVIYPGLSVCFSCTPSYKCVHLPSPQLATCSLFSICWAGLKHFLSNHICSTPLLSHYKLTFASPSGLSVSMLLLPTSTFPSSYQSTMDHKSQNGSPHTYCMHITAVHAKMLHSREGKTPTGQAHVFWFGRIQMFPQGILIHFYFQYMFC